MTQPDPTFQVKPTRLLSLKPKNAPLLARVCQPKSPNTFVMLTTTLSSPSPAPNMFLRTIRVNLSTGTLSDRDGNWHPMVAASESTKQRYYKQ